MGKIETYVIPRHLYRYRSLKNFGREMEAIKTGHVYCATYKEMNDPMEGFYSSSKLLIHSQELEGVQGAILSRKIRIGICSFSEVFDHELMWAHQANRFEGICIAYDFFNLRRYLPDGATFSRVYYNEEVPEIGRSRQPRNFDETAKKILSYKNYRWLYEREWRLFAKIGKVFYRHPRCVARVYIGAAVPTNRKRRIQSLLKALKIPCQIQTVDGDAMSFQREDAVRQRDAQPQATT